MSEVIVEVWPQLGQPDVLVFKSGERCCSVQPVDAVRLLPAFHEEVARELGVTAAEVAKALPSRE